MLRVTERVGSLALEQPLEPVLALGQGQGGQVLAVEREEVEGVVDQRLAIAERRLQRVKGRAAGLPARHDLAVEQRAGAGQGVKGAGQRAEPGGPVEAGAGVEPLAAAAERDEAAIAVELGLVQPAIALRRLVHQRRQLRLAERRSRAGALRRRALRRLALGGGGGQLAAVRVVAVPDRARRILGDRVHGPAGHDAPGKRLRQPVRLVRRRIVALLDQQPVLALLALARAHPDQRPAAFHALAVDQEMQHAALQPLGRVVQRLPGALVPHHDGAAAVLSFGDRPLEGSVGERVVLGPDGEAFLGRIVARAPRDRPAEQHAVPFQPQVVVQAARRVLLHEEGQRSVPRFAGRALRFARLGEVALGVVLGELAAARRHQDAFLRGLGVRFLACPALAAGGFLAALPPDDLPAALPPGLSRLAFSAAIRSMTFSPP